ncbi:hypothetical protein pipiens_015546 [Culex pipiens pipiens]|uniref:CHK kinase-like domain-containing protein n=1 Tax=Culex pipiens pipiens TaxID=38569 RepID=A0ABD1CQ24_CULPP
MFRARITEDGRELVVLCKVPPVNEVRRQHFGAMIIFEREFEAYSKILPAIYEFQRERGVTEELGEGFFNAPKCYLAYFEAKKEETAILMEDLRLQGYRMWNKMIPVDYEHVKLLMVQLGRLHAVSFAMKDQRPEMFEPLKVSDPFSVMFDGNEPVMGMIQTSLERAVGLLNLEDKLLPKLLAFKSTLFQDLKDLLSVCRYVSPALDLLHFIFCCTDACLTPMLVSESHELPDMEQLPERFEETRTMTLEVKSGETERRYRKRMGEVLRDVAAFGYM